MELEHQSYQLLPQPGQCTLYVQVSASLCSLAALAEVLSSAKGAPARALSRLLVVVEGGVLAGEIPQSG